MKKILLLFSAFLLMNSYLYAQQVDFTEFDLENGLHVILHQDNLAPVVTTSIMYDVGGKDGDRERTGFAHFFEHLLFEGSKNIGRGEFMKIIPANGGTFNANTSQDRTYYFETFPSNKLELGLWLESERMLHPVIDQVGVDTQNEVVKEEKRQRYDAPYGKLLKVLNENLFKVHPYKDQNIGKMEHLDAATLEEFMTYHKTYYGPNNAVLIVAGDIDTEETIELVKKYFDEVPRGNEVVRNFPKEEPITENIRAKAYDKNIQIPMLLSSFRTPGFASRDSYVLDMISTYLSSGKSSVLYKKLVDDQKQALQTQVINLGQVDYNIFAILALPLGDISLDILLTEIEEEIEKVQNELISERDHQKLLNKFESQFVNSNSSIAGIANSLARYYLLYGDVNLINKEIDIYRSITREEIRSVAQKYLSSNQRVDIEYLPETGE
ncbi:MAG: insulinase family protein [Flavobacteriaceae bacterium]|jgi:zinc protease|nr:insulinase family protein [Flavobacteriaceae bacterium]MBT4113944.1 insulinase family protein [Flavobacteriaceae bacterium]MBT4613856.1 insulinase family protein [Flavobacteriaceae bacterium]MBT5246423.1 insulinase family protein [Flavobacteriaceae bacterium]MBT5650768.1 insulinase family protein [Flavobacteriaceae bacterium]